MSLVLFDRIRIKRLLYGDYLLKTSSQNFGNLYMMKEESWLGLDELYIYEDLLLRAGQDPITTIHSGYNNML